MSLESANVRLALGRRVAFHVFNATPTRMVVLDGHSMVCAIPIMACAKSSHRLSAWTRLITPLRQHRLMEIVGCTRIGFCWIRPKIFWHGFTSITAKALSSTNVADAIAVQSIFSKFCWSGEEGSAYYDGYKGFTVPQTFDNAVLLRKPNATTNLQGAVYLPVFSQILYLDSEIDYSKRFDRLEQPVSWTPFVQTGSRTMRTGASYALFQGNIVIAYGGALNNIDLADLMFMTVTSVMWMEFHFSRVPGQHRVSSNNSPELLSGREDPNDIGDLAGKAV